MIFFVSWKIQTSCVELAVFLAHFLILRRMKLLFEIDKKLLLLYIIENQLKEA